jgi:hypothetical protein
MLLCSSSFWSKDAPAWMGRNKDSLLRAADEPSLASATRGGSCAHPDQSRGLVQRHNMRAITVPEHLRLFYSFSLGVVSPYMNVSWDTRFQEQTSFSP